MPPCDYTSICVDFDERRYKEQVLQLLTALLQSTATADYEYQILCDAPEDSITPFVRQVTIECDGTKVVEDFELDYVTPYVVSDEANVTTCGLADIPTQLCLDPIDEFPVAPDINCIVNIIGHADPLVVDGLYYWNGVTWIALATD